MKRILIIGASGGIGAAVALRLAQGRPLRLAQGRPLRLASRFAKASQDKSQDKPQDKSQDKPQDRPQDAVEVILHGRDEERLRGVAEGFSSATATGDDTKETGPERPDSSGGDRGGMITGDVVGWAEDPKRIPEIEPVDAVVWCAGICELAAGQMLSAKALERTLRSNLVAPLVVCSWWYRKRVIKDGGRIVLIGSEAAHTAGEGFSMYAASKGGLASAARVLGKEFARRGVSVHCLEPGTVDTPMTRKLIETFGGVKDPSAGSGQASGARLGDPDYPMVEAREVAEQVVRVLEFSG